MENTYKINIDRQVIKLLGEHLYGDTPSVINELIANAYDARAKRVWITLKTTTPYGIIVEDDGIGMTIDEINKYYLNIGYNRRQQPDLQATLGSTGDVRADMGQKGIGKLAVFALSKVVNLISFKGGQAVGCQMDFDVITQNDGNPQPLDLSDSTIDESKLSQGKSGTRIELTNVVKNLSKAYRFIVSRIARSFVTNDGAMKVFIQKDQEQPKEIKRGELNFFEEMDTIITVGTEFTEYAQRVTNNSINERYKYIYTYENMVMSQTQGVGLDSLPVTIKVFDKKRVNLKDFAFSFKGWVGTVQNAEAYKSILKKGGYTDGEIESKEIEVVNDNRITVYSRGKVGEYDILPKVQTKAQNDAYIIGEIFVDDFEHNDFIDMATSNRRGYQEDDARYEALCRNLKIVVNRLVSEKQKISRKRKQDEDDAESKAIADKFVTGQIESKPIIQDKLTDDDREKLVADFKQFSRALSLTQSTKRIFISHKADCKDFGEFLIKVLLKINPALKQGILFTSLPEYGVKNGEDIFDYLKKCFRDDLFVVFLFSRSFYDSNICISEAGAAWATNKKYSNIVIDMGFNTISEPINRAQSGASFKFANANDKRQFIGELQYILREVDKQYEDAVIEKALDEVLKETPNINLPWYLPERRFQAVPVCNKCNHAMTTLIVCGTGASGSIELHYKCACGEEQKGIIL